MLTASLNSERRFYVLLVFALSIIFIQQRPAQLLSISLYDQTSCVQIGAIKESSHLVYAANANALCDRRYRDSGS